MPMSSRIPAAETGAPRPPRNAMDRFIDGIELIAASFVGIVAARYLHLGHAALFLQRADSRPLRFRPASARYSHLLGHCRDVYRGNHITVDLLYANVGARCKRVIDVFATLVLLFVVTVQTYTCSARWGTCADHVLTYDLRLPVWPFFLVAWIGDVSAVLLIAVRTYRLIFHPELLGGQYQIKAVE